MSVGRSVALDVETVSGLAFTSIWKGRSLTRDALRRTTGWTAARIDAAIDQLQTAGRVELGDGGIMGAHGVTLHVTPHRIRHEDGETYTWCAFDAIGIPAALAVDAAVTSNCPTCGRRLLVGVRAGEPDVRPEVVWMPHGPCEHVMNDFCSISNLFCSREHLDEWRRAAGAPAGETLTLGEAARQGRRVWDDVGPWTPGHRGDEQTRASARSEAASGDNPRP